METASNIIPNTSGNKKSVKPKKAKSSKTGDSAAVQSKQIDKIEKDDKIGQNPAKKITKKKPATKKTKQSGFVKFFNGEAYIHNDILKDVIAVVTEKTDNVDYPVSVRFDLKNSNSLMYKIRAEKSDKEIQLGNVTRRAVTAIDKALNGDVEDDEEMVDNQNHEENHNVIMDKIDEDFVQEIEVAVVNEEVDDSKSDKED